MTTVKVGQSRQVVIPKKLYDELGLHTGDLLEVEVREGGILFKPKLLIDKRLEALLLEGLDSGPPKAMSEREWKALRKLAEDQLRKRKGA